MKESINISGAQVLSGVSLENVPVKLTEPERPQPLIESNAPTAKFPWYQCVHQLFEFQAGQTPEAVALDWAGGRLS